MGIRGRWRGERRSGDGACEGGEGIWVRRLGLAGVVMMGASRRHSSRERAQVVGMRKEAVAKAGAVVGKTGEAEGRVTRVEEVGGVIEIPVEVGEGEDVADKVDEMDRAIGTRAEAAVRDEAATIWKLTVSPRQWHMVVYRSSKRTHPSSLHVSIDLG